MSEESTTKNLGIPLILGSDYVMKDKINDSIKTIDNVVLPQSHADSKAHFDMWQPNTAYKKQDVVRTPTCPSWGFYMCTIAGISAIVEPQGYGEGDSIIDGTVTWTLKLFGGSTSIKHSDLIGRNLENQHEIKAITGLQDALDLTVTKENLKKTIDDLIADAPETLDTLKEIADALADDDSAIAAIMATLSGKVDKIEGRGLSTNDYSVLDKAKIDKITITEAIDLDSLNKRAHIHDNKNSLDKYGEKNNQPTFNGKSILGGAPNWTANTEYESTMLVVHNGKLYRCRISHISDDKFKQIYWELLSSESADLKQLTKLNVIAPVSLDIPISYTNKFRLPPVEILKFNSQGGEQDQLFTMYNFDNADAEDFIVDVQSAELSDQFIFDGVMRKNTEYKIKVNNSENMDGNTICESDFIDFSGYKTIENIQGGFL